MGARNMVISGDYAGKSVISSLGQVNILLSGFSFKDSIIIDRYSVESYEVLLGEQTKSLSSGVARGLVGGALLGPVGMLAGGLSAKNKGVYQIALQFKDGKRSLLEVDDKIYKTIISTCFNKPEREEENAAQGFSGADELLKWKKLLDDGIITENEYNKKKKDLLGL